MRSRVALATSGLSRSASETVAVETPSASAIVESLIFCASEWSPAPGRSRFKVFKSRLEHAAAGSQSFSARSPASEDGAALRRSLSTCSR